MRIHHWVGILAMACGTISARGEDWGQFRGSDGTAVSHDAAPPVEWSNTNHLAWKTVLPGPGTSSPIVVGDRVFVTCFTGQNEDGTAVDPSKLKRHLICINRRDGKINWTTDVSAVLPEDPYRGFLTEHGYASSTPASDGENVYVFFGKSGVLAFDLEGHKLWHTNVGKESDKRGWGSGSSLLLYKNMVIVNASSESQSIRALNKKTGKEIWKAEASTLSLCFGTPTVVELPGGKAELIVSAPGEVWGLNPETGKLLWFAGIRTARNVCPSLATADGIIFAMGGFETHGTSAIRAGGQDDVSKSHVLWSVPQCSYIPSPLISKGHLYWVDDSGKAMCMNASDGKVKKEVRLPIKSKGGRMKPVYASVVMAGDELIAVSRSGGVCVLSATPELKVLGTNHLEDDSEFNATPAVSQGQLFLRSNRAVYCIANQ